ncbi:MAG: globin-coupled sensor protein [Alphaproteobacteria bacterium]|nr:globin-coupled sensor protein [Alphaproteobacteria bacterium]
MTQESGPVQSDRSARLAFMLIDPKTGDMLREVWKAIAPRLPQVLDGFYRHCTSDPALAKLIGNRIAHLKGAQSNHWSKLFSGRFDDAYMQAVRTIGNTHFRIGLEPRWYIAGYAYVLNALSEILVGTYRGSPKKLVEALAAVNKAILLDMEIAVSVYQETMIAERMQRQKRVDAAVGAFDAAASAAIGSVGKAITLLMSDSASLNATAEEASKQSSAVAAACEQASANVETVATASEELSSSISEISRQVSQSAAIAAQAVAQADKTNAEVESLNAAAQKIGDVVKLINDIAGQTNLLALNATIEAARAGEAGKGFAVVAAEVKSLANQTARATGEIGAQISAMQAATNGAVAAIQGISLTISEINQIAASIASAVEEQGVATKEIAENVSEAAKGTGEVSLNIAGVNTSARQTGASAGRVAEAAEDLAKQSEMLRLQIDAFIGEVKAA